MLVSILSLLSGALSAVLLLSLYSKSKQQNSYMKKTLLLIATLLASYVGMAQETYHPTAENLKAREQFQDEKFGIFLHWGLYSMMGTTEWIMTNRDINYKEYPKLAKTFYPSEFDADAWVLVQSISPLRHATTMDSHSLRQLPARIIPLMVLLSNVTSLKKWLMLVNEMVSSCIFTILTLTGDAKTIQWEELELALVDQKRRLTGQATISL